MGRGKNTEEAKEIPESIAIAGLYGYMGILIYNAAVSLGIKKIYGYDPGERPVYFLETKNLEMIANEKEFYSLDADLFHLALHPRDREPIYDLIERGVHINCEKPMAHPEEPIECLGICEAVKSNSSTLLFDFLDLFNPMMHNAVSYLKELSQYDDFKITRMILERSKDREDAEIARNYKVMVPIEWQESVHDFAAILYILGNMHGTVDFDKLFPGGLKIKAKSEYYSPPNPRKYGYKVDGKVEGVLKNGSSTYEMHTNFKSGAQSKKLTTIRGKAGGRRFEIAVSTQAGDQYLMIDGRRIDAFEKEDSYRNIITNSWKIHNKGFSDTFSDKLGIVPDAKFAMRTYMLSGALAKSAYRRKTGRVYFVDINSEDDFLELTEWFSQAVERGRFGRY